MSDSRQIWPWSPDVYSKSKTKYLRRRIILSRSLIGNQIHPKEKILWRRPAPTERSPLAGD